MSSSTMLISKDLDPNLALKQDTAVEYLSVQED